MAGPQLEMLCNNLASLPPIPTAPGYTLRELQHSLYWLHVPLEINPHLSLPAATISDDDGHLDESCRDSLWSEQVRSDPVTRQAGVYRPFPFSLMEFLSSESDNDRLGWRIQ
jgi:hypothetical protein